MIHAISRELASVVQLLFDSFILRLFDCDFF